MPLPLTLNLIESLPVSQALHVLAELRNLPADEKAQLRYRWEFWRRPLTQLPERGERVYGGQTPPPGDWRWWFILSGRGYGKTWTGAQFTRWKAEFGGARYIGLIGETAADVRDVMVEGESGILAISPPWFMPKYEPSKRRLTWPNGATATTFSGDEPGQLRGPQHDFIWADEPAKWKYPQEAWDNAEMGLRLGVHPQGVATTTPRPIPLIKDLVTDSDTVVTTGSTYENAANLAPSFIRRVLKKYEGTRLGRQELHAEILSDTPGALWTRDQLDALRVAQNDLPEHLVRIVVAVDPSATGNPESDEAGIIVAGLGENGHGYVLDDYSLQGSPHAWASAAVAAYHRYHADRIVAEVNNGGEMVGFTIHTVDPTVSYKAVHASRGKLTRAEPVAALYEQGRISHIGVLPRLEDEMVTWTPGDKSPNRMDALVWAFTELLLDERRVPLADEPDPAAPPAAQSLLEVLKEAQADPFAWADQHATNW